MYYIILGIVVRRLEGWITRKAEYFVEEMRNEKLLSNSVIMYTTVK